MPIEALLAMYGYNEDEDGAQSAHSTSSEEDEEPSNSVRKIFCVLSYTKVTYSKAKQVFFNARFNVNIINRN